MTPQEIIENLSKTRITVDVEGGLDYYNKIDPSDLLRELGSKTLIQWADDIQERNREYFSAQEKFSAIWELENSYADELEELGVDAEEFYDEHSHELYGCMDYEGSYLKFILGDCQIPMVAKLHSNYDCQNSNHFVGGEYEATETYFGDVLKVLSIDAEALHGNEFISVMGLNGVEDGGYVDHDEFCEELANNTCTGLFTLAFSLDAYTYLKWLWKVEGNEDAKLSLKLPVNTRYGVWSDWAGGGSIMDGTLRKELTITDSEPLDDSGYLMWSIDIDGASGYGVIGECELQVEEAKIIDFYL